MKNIEQCLRVINYGEKFRGTFQAINVVFVSQFFRAEAIPFIVDVSGEQQ